MKWWSTWRSCASLLMQHKFTASFCSACSPACATLALLQSNLATSVMHAERAPLSTAPSWWWLVSFFHSLFPQVYQPFSFSFLGLCALHATIALFCLFSLYHAKSCCYLLFRPMSTSPFLLILGLLLFNHLRGFVQLLTTSLCFSSSCLSLGEKTLCIACQALAGRWTRWEGDAPVMEHTNVAAFATASHGLSIPFAILPVIQTDSFLWLPEHIFCKASAQTGRLALRLAFSSISCKLDELWLEVVSQVPCLWLWHSQEENLLWIGYYSQ